MHKAIDIGVVLVTYNRLAMLKKALESYDAQIKKPQYILVVNNACNDGTQEYLYQWRCIETDYKKIVINLDKNVGGSGGFYEGLLRAQQMAAEWIWVADDDAFLQEDALKEAENYLLTNVNLISTISAVCGMVINNGEIDINHRKNIRQRGLSIKVQKVDKSMYKSNFEINAFSYVGTMINKEKLLEAGLPERGYFIWHDDTEHSLRLSRKGKIICVPDIKIQHDTEAGQGGLSWKLYYGFRNTAYTYKKHFSKMCYICFYYLTLAKACIKIMLRYHVEYSRIQICAIKDAQRNKLGLHEKYRPGWKP